MLLGVGAASAPLTFVASSTVGAGSGTSNVINKPTGAQAGDLLIIAVVHGSSDTTVAISGFVTEFTDSSSTPRIRVFSRVLDGSEGATFTITGANSARTVVAVAYRGGAPDVNVVGATSGTSTSASGIAPSITATQAGVLLSFHASSSSPSVISSGPAGMTQRGFLSSAFALAVYELSSSPVGATGSKTITWSSSYPNNNLLAQIY